MINESRFWARVFVAELDVFAAQPHPLLVALSGDLSSQKRIAGFHFCDFVACFYFHHSLQAAIASFYPAFRSCVLKLCASGGVSHCFCYAFLRMSSGLQIGCECVPEVID